MIKNSNLNFKMFAKICSSGLAVFAMAFCAYFVLNYSEHQKNWEQTHIACKKILPLNPIVTGEELIKTVPGISQCAANEVFHFLYPVAKVA